jgi:hypothetical protein
MPAPGVAQKRHTYCPISNTTRQAREKNAAHGRNDKHDGALVGRSRFGRDGGILALFGVMITGLINAKLQRDRLAYDNRVRDEEQVRERQAIRSIVFALLSDLKMLTRDARRTAEFDPARWRVAVDRLLHRADQLETAAALADNNLVAVLEAAFDVERRLQMIEQLPPPRIEDAPPGPYPPAKVWLRSRRIVYLHEIQGHAMVADVSVERALSMLGGSSGSSEPELSTDELLKQRFGRDEEASGVNS